jgi:hypothetical protein
MSRSRRSMNRLSLVQLLFALMVFAGACNLAFATPAVQITNNTRGGNTIFFVGDSYTVTINSGAPNAPVVVSDPRMGSFQVGYTTSNGSYTMNGSPSNVDIGAWNETWTVAGVAATPNPLTFYVYALITPTVQITNNTRGGNTIFFVGDSYTVTVSGGVPNAPIVVGDPRMGSFQVGYANSNGIYTMNGSPSNADIGAWNETWTVAGVAATPNPLQFTVYAASMAGCSFSYPPWVWNTTTDNIDRQTKQIVGHSGGEVWFSVGTNPAGACVIYGVQTYSGLFTQFEMMSGGSYYQSWRLRDTYWRPGYDPQRGPESYYPISDPIPPAVIWYLQNTITNETWGAQTNGSTTVYFSYN